MSGGRLYSNSEVISPRSIPCFCFMVKEARRVRSYRVVYLSNSVILAKLIGKVDRYWSRPQTFAFNCTLISTGRWNFVYPHFLWKLNSTLFTIVYSVHCTCMYTLCQVHIINEHVLRQFY